MIYELSFKDKLRDLKLPTAMTQELAEETGIHLGDGSMNIYGSSHKYSLEGDPKFDRDYYIKHIAPLYEKLYNLKVRLRDRSCAGVFGFQIGSKGLINFKSKFIGLPLGPKINAEIPELIKTADKEIIAAFIRGLFDTDGNLYLEKKNNKLYPRIKISGNAKKLIEQVKEILEKQFNFNLSFLLDDKTYCITIRGEENTIKWMKLIGSNNQKHINKYSYWLSSRG